jgi:uncharacterized protein (DUF1697 family)
MPNHIALLRGINVGGRKLLPMSDLRSLFEALGLADVQSLLQSGNVLFQSESQTEAELEQLLQVETEKRLGASVEYMVRSAAEWKTIVTANPFPTEAKQDPGHLLVLCLKKAPSAAEVKTLQAAITGPEIIRAKGRQLYAVYPAGVGTSKLTNALIERKLQTRATGRNWNTVLKLAELLK